MCMQFTGKPTEKPAENLFDLSDQAKFLDFLDISSRCHYCSDGSPLLSLVISPKKYASKRTFRTVCLSCAFNVLKENSHLFIDPRQTHEFLSIFCNQFDIEIPYTTEEVLL